MSGEKYGIKLKNDSNAYLNNIRCDFGRIVFVNFVKKEHETVMLFSSKSDAESLAQRITKHRKLAVETVLM